MSLIAIADGLRRVVRSVHWRGPIPSTDWNEKPVEIMLTEKTNALMPDRNAAIMHVGGV